MIESLVGFPSDIVMTTIDLNQLGDIMLQIRIYYY